MAQIEFTELGCLYLLTIFKRLEKSTQNLRVQIIITLLGIGLFVLKILAWWLTHSVAILTDALESTVNVLAGFLGIYSLYISAQPKDKNHPYGHGKAEFLSAAIEGSLISVAGLLIIYEAVDNLMHPHEIKKLDNGIMLVGITAVVNFFAGYYVVNLGKKNHSQVLIASGNHLKTDTYSTFGIIAGLICMKFIPVWWLDSAIAILFAFIILFTGFGIIRSSIAGIMDEADEALIIELVKTLNANRQENWIDFHNLRIIKYGATLHIDCHLTVPWFLNVNEAHREIDTFSKIAQEKFGESIEMFVHSDGCLDFSCSICNKQNCIERKNPYMIRIEWTVENVTSDLKHQL